MCSFISWSLHEDPDLRLRPGVSWPGLRQGRRPEDDILAWPAQRPRFRRFLALGAVGLFGLVATAGAQPFDFPVQERPELPEPRDEAPTDFGAPDEGMLPDIPVEVTQPDLRVRVRGYRISGSRVFTPEELEEALAPWVGREIGSEDLTAIRNTITQLYVDAGYVNSGAVIPDQDLSDGFVELEVVEGTLSWIDVSGTEQYRDWVLRDRLAASIGEPLRVQDVELALQLLQQDPRIERVHARLAPGERPGDAVLSVRVEEAQPYRVSMEASNYAPVAFGSYRGRFVLGHNNLFGLGDALEGHLRVAGGLIRGRAEYRLPLLGYGTEFFVRGEYTRSKVIEAEFEPLDIKTYYRSVRLGIVHPVYRSERSTVKLSLLGDWRQSETTLLGSPFTFARSGAVDGTTTVAPLRLVAEWTFREQNQVLAARSVLSVGLPVLGARENVLNGPDGQFVSWLAQFQWARRFSFLNIQTIFRTDIQVTDNALPTLEQLSVGGHQTVRGYRENQHVRDQGVIWSVEARVPVWQRERPILEIAPFVDFGWSDNLDRPVRGSNILASIGAGLRWSILPQLRAQVYYGYSLVDEESRGGNLPPVKRSEDDLQDHGVQFGLTWDAF